MIRVAVPSSGKCVHIDNLSQGTFAYSIIDCPSGGITYGSTVMPAGTFYGDSTITMAFADSEARDNKSTQWEGR
jgi:hypothetical protein